MATNIGPTNGKTQAIAEMNTTPLIDVLLVLLVMLIVTVPIQTNAVKIDMPNGPVKSGVHPVVNLVVDFDGTAVWNGVPVPDRATLDSYFRDAAARSPQPEIQVRPDRLAKYGQVAVVLADAQRSGVTKIGFAGNEQYME